MSTTQIYILLGVGLITLFVVALVFLWPYLRGGHLGSHARNMSSVGRTTSELGGMKDTFARVSKVGVEGSDVKISSAELTLEKKLKYAQWKMKPTTYRIFMVLGSASAVIIAMTKFNIIFQAAALFMGPMLMGALVMRAVNKRFKAFDRDYPAFLLSLVGLLKTGMNPLQGLGAAAESLEEESLVRQEIEVMLERLRLGVSEDKSIGAFGEDVYHPEIELFVQALILSRRLGGTLSDTLDRLARQVRRRQYFREQAVAAVGLQRGSIWFILSIQVGLMFYIYLVLPQFVMESIESPQGWQVWQFGIMVMAIGMYWVRKVSNIRV